jgi:hypothetical protein
MIALVNVAFWLQRRMFNKTVSSDPAVEAAGKEVCDDPSISSKLSA